MEGYLLVPPDRGTIIGRALWKPRYVVLGSAAPPQNVPDLPLPRTGSSTRLPSTRTLLRPSPLRTSLGDITTPEAQDGLYLSIYKDKAKGEWECVQQYHIYAFTSCEIQQVAHRKQSPSLPTLIIRFRQEVTEKQQKRRSSRAAALTSKDPWSDMLLFRTVPEDGYGIHDWLSVIRPLIRSDFAVEPAEPIMSPISPGPSFFTNPFTNPFSPPRESRSNSNSNQRPEFKHRSSSNQTSSTYSNVAPRERPSAVISPSPSLRSKRSDLSSQASSQHPPLALSSSIAQNQPFPPLGPTELPSPASTTAYDVQFIEGWTSAQGRSSALSTHTRGSNSIASAVSPFGSSPPGPRETILDRAFNMRYIPGSEKLPDVNEDGNSGDGRISSIARFEKLMREREERRMQKATRSSQVQEKRRSGRSKNGWEIDEGSELEDGDVEYEGEADSEDEAHTRNLDLSAPYDPSIVIPTPAQRALDFISGRQNTPHSPPPPRSKSRPMSPEAAPPIPFLNQQAMDAFHKADNDPYSQADAQPSARPRTGTQPGKRWSRPHSMALPSRSASTNTIPTLKELQISAPSGSSSLRNSESAQPQNHNRRSSASLKRLSFQEFARRLSSTSSLLLVQTNVSSGSHSSSGSASRRESASARGSSDSYADGDVGEAVWSGKGSAGLRSSSNFGGPIRGSGEIIDREAARERERDPTRDWDSEREKRCGWRGSVGVFGDGGFL
ncbi:hypothetical protein F5884DRAFT_89019 [Xylogone sp. PMI_703]|nr:hypothetical protein F5884DRAFT_89019 [Xylogone sp. PMI_703]